MVHLRLRVPFAGRSARSPGQAPRARRDDDAWHQHPLAQRARRRPAGDRRRAVGLDRHRSAAGARASHCGPDCRACSSCWPRSSPTRNTQGRRRRVRCRGCRRSCSSGCRSPARSPPRRCGTGSIPVTPTVATCPTRRRSPASRRLPCAGCIVAGSCPPGSLLVMVGDITPARVLDQVDEGAGRLVGRRDQARTRSRRPDRWRPDAGRPAGCGAVERAARR